MTIRTFFRKIPVRAFSSYAEVRIPREILNFYPHVINNRSLHELENARKIQANSQRVETELVRQSEELLARFPNRIAPEKMDKFLKQSISIKKHSSVY